MTDRTPSPPAPAPARYPVPPRGTERLLVAIGRISATHRTVLTPAGSAPVNAVRWALREQVPTRRLRWPGRSDGSRPATTCLTVTVTGPDWQHSERVEAATVDDVAALRAKVTQARMLALRAVVWSVGEPAAPAVGGPAAPAVGGPVAPAVGGPAAPNVGRPLARVGSVPLPTGAVRLLTARAHGEVTEPAR